MKRSISLGIVAIMIFSMTFGCLKMENEITVHPNGSATGTVTVGIQEEFWNLTGGNLTFGNFTLTDAENATIWTEDGWVYIREEDLFVPEENMGIQVIPGSGYTEYVIDANLSDVQEEVSEEGEYNLSDPFVQMFLAQMTFKFTIVMPGEIIDSNAHEQSGSTAKWSYDVASMQSADRLYVRSKYISEINTMLSLLPLLIPLGLGRKLRAG